MTLYSGTPTTLVAGDTSALVTKFNDHRDAIKALSEAPTAYTPAYTGGINAIGDAVVAASYHRVDKWIEGQVKITMGSTTTFVASAMIISLPVATHADYASGAALGSAYFLDASVGSSTRTSGAAVTLSSTTVMIVGGTQGVTLSNTVPWTWTTSDVLSFQFRYPAA